MIYLLLLIGLITLTKTQAVFAPADTAALKAAVGSCTVNYNTNPVTYPCTGGCLGETPDGSCPKFAASNDAGNPYGVIGDWDVSEVTDMSFMFRGAYAFNGDISKWNAGKVTNMIEMFYKATAFNADISKWNTGKVTNMEEMFRKAAAFNADISKWNTAAVTNMEEMFQTATAFNSDISKWNTGVVAFMGGMFQGATAFNSDISKWNTGVVTDMNHMLAQTEFNNDISKWNTGAVTSMMLMLYGSKFNGDISKWNTGAVTNMNRMFESSSFKRTLCGGQWQLLSSNNKLETTGRLECCPAGSYMSNPLLDPFSAANSCSQCPPGSFESAQNDDTQCTACVSGKYSIGGASSCPYSATTCPAGTYASGTACQPCSAGTYSSTVGITDCKVCSADKYSTTTGRTTDCDQSCPVGTHISDTTTATKHDQESDCRLCSFENELVGCTDDEWQKIKVFYNNRPSC